MLGIQMLNEDERFGKDWKKSGRFVLIFGLLVWLLRSTKMRWRSRDNRNIKTLLEAAVLRAVKKLRIPFSSSDERHGQPGR